ncbi:hypothetical protein [Pantoea stewartii]|uniref:hypothetical protein n=1 Tax=Pantoea stewartii TaxID=66269 RepID=UPI0012468ADA|nr:hypothetical protein [Pantoea stewartii]KAB0545525.1 hypothetical protein F7Q90_24500 [Pantoea stewartii subsp. stewartii]
MSQNWMRHFELQLVSENKPGISLSDFKVTFDIERNDNRWPATANFKIYNLSPETQNRIMQREFSKIIIIAGYDGIAPDYTRDQVDVERQLEPEQVGQTAGSNFGVLFSGEIRFAVTGKENITDSWISIQACDGEQAFYNAFISANLQRGYTKRDVYNLLMDNLKPYGIVPGVVPEFPSVVYPRGATFYGPVRDYLSTLAEDLQATWQFSYGRLDMIQKDVATHTAVVLNADTGLIGMPQQTIGNGVNIRCLINTRIHLHGLVQLDQASVYRAELSGDQVVKAGGPLRERETNGNLTVSGLAQKENPANIATDGVYIVRYIMITGDTRGKAWYMDMACEARGNADVNSESTLVKWGA